MELVDKRLKELNKHYKNSYVDGVIDCNDVDLYYDNLEIEFACNQRDVDDWDEVHITVSCTYTVNVEEIQEILEDFVYESDMEFDDDFEALTKYVRENFKELIKIYKGYILEYYEDSAISKAIAEYESSEPDYDDYDYYYDDED